HRRAGRGRALSAAAGRRRRALFGAVALLYLLAFPYHPGLRSPNELSRLWQARALVEFGALDLNATIRTYGYVGDRPSKAGRLCPSKAPLVSFAAVPVDAALRAAGGGGRHAAPERAYVYRARLRLTVLPTLAALLLVWRFLRAYVPEPVADGVTA